MHNQTDQMERPMRAGHAEKLASRVGGGGFVRAGESPAASTLRGFGFSYEGGRLRHWYFKDGVKRWADDDSIAV